MEDIPEYLILLGPAETQNLTMNLTDREHHYILKYSKENSTINSLREKKAFGTGTYLTELSDQSQEDRIRIIEKMLSERLLVQIPVLEYNPNGKHLSIAGYFISLTEKNESNTASVYLEAIKISAESVAQMIQQQELPLPEQILADFETDFKSQKKPDESALKCLFINFMKDLTLSVMPHQNLLSDFKKEISRILTENKKVIMVPEYGIIPFNEKYSRNLFEQSVLFLKEKIIPEYSKFSDLKAELLNTDIEEDRYLLDPAAVPKPDFDIQRAASIRNIVHAHYSSRSSETGNAMWFPGFLVSEVILSMADYIKTAFQNEWQNNLNQQKQMFKSLFSKKEGSAIHEYVRFLTASELEAMHPEIQNSIMDDPEFMVQEWYTPSEKYYIFFRFNKNLFDDFIRQLLFGDSLSGWKLVSVIMLLAEKKLIYKDSYTKELVKFINQLQAKALLDYMPFFHKLLILSGITLFRQKAVYSAESVLRRRQMQNRILNDSREEKRKSEKKNAMLLKEQVFLKKKIAGKLIIILDQFYLENLKIPLYSDIKSKMSSSDSENLDTIIHEDHFLLLIWNKKNPDQDPIVMYPADNEWRLKSLFLSRSLEKIFTKINENAVLSEGVNEVELAKARAVQAYLKKSGETGSVMGYSNQSDANKESRRVIK
jgi:hypothetical protein